MAEKMRVMTENPLNAETRPEFLRSWITANSVFFDRNQNAVMEEPVNLADWRLTVEGEVKEGLHLSFEEILRMPKAMVSNTLECSGNSRSLLKEKAKGNPWTIGGVGNAVWSGVWLRDVLEKAGLKAGVKHVAFEGLDKSMGSKGIKFIRSIPIEKAMTSSLLAYEMNGEPLPLKHGFPLRGLALGWTGANCVKWLQKISVLERPFEGFFMDTVYRIYQKGQDPKSGQVVKSLAVKSIITQPLQGEKVPSGAVTILGASYAGESGIECVELSLDGGKTWEAAEFIGPREPYAWRQWQYVLKAPRRGGYTVFSRATDSEGRKQPANAHWNVLGYGNNGIEEHAVTFQVT